MFVYGTEGVLAVNALSNLSGTPGAWYVGSDPRYLSQDQKDDRVRRTYFTNLRPSWPLLKELAAIKRGVVCIHDFDIGQDGYGYDSYAGIDCNANMVNQWAPIYGNLAYGQSSEGKINQSNYRGVYSFHENGAYVVMCDASVRFLCTSIKPRVVLALMSRDGYEEIHDDDLE